LAYGGSGATLIPFRPVQVARAEGDWGRALEYNAISTVEFRPIEPFGAEVDLDLRCELPDEQADDLRDLFRQHHLLIFRDQQLTPEQFRAAMAHLGPLPLETTYVSTDPNVGAQGRLKLAFHSDLAFAQKPDLGVALYAIDVVDDETATKFANASTALGRLPSELRARLEGLQCRHVWPVNEATRNHEAPLRDSDPRAVHPLIADHPVTGEPVLFVNYMQTDCILGMTADDSEALLQELFGYLYDPDNILVHRWRAGALAVFDNYFVQHARDELTAPGIRSLMRVTLAEQGFFEQFPQFAAMVDGFTDDRHGSNSI